MADDRHQVAVRIVARNLICLAINRVIQSRLDDRDLAHEVIDQMRRERDHLAVNPEELAAAWLYLDQHDHPNVP